VPRYDIPACSALGSVRLPEAELFCWRQDRLVADAESLGLYDADPAEVKAAQKGARTNREA
jgi:hypothetical protein